MKKPIKQMYSNEKPFTEEKKPEKEVATYSIATSKQEIMCKSINESLAIQAQTKGVIWAVINGEYCYIIEK